MFALCAADAERARAPGTPSIRAGQNLMLGTCVEVKFDQLRKFTNLLSYAAMFFPDRIAPCGERSRLPDLEKALPPYDFIELKEPRLYDFERFSNCLMTPP